MIENPIISGFNPDPSIIRVEKDYYIATSTFEWFPGVQIHHSTDLINWELITHPLNDVAKLDLVGVPNSGGVWAPCLSYCNDKFYLVYSISREWTGVYKDVDNFLVTAQNIMGPWSDPIYINSAGFDASLFHDPNTNKKWYTCVNWDYRKSNKGNSAECFNGIIMQEFDENKGELVGEVFRIFGGTELGLVEAPHQYYYNGYYYLMVAEGGTFEGHAVTLCRSENITGPYELHPDNPILTSHNNPNLYLQRSGHASLVETDTGDFYLAHLCGRPHKPENRCNLGRETALQKMEWKDNWLYKIGNKYPDRFVEAPYNNTKKKEPQLLFFEDFKKSKLSINFNSLRVPISKDWLTYDNGKLNLRGRDSLFSKHYQSTVARRVKHFKANATTLVYFNPKSHFHSAGLIYFYDTDNHYYLRVTYDEILGKVVNLLLADKTETIVITKSVPIESTSLYLKAELRDKDICFYYSENGENYIQLGQKYDATKISDEYCGMHFTGAFFGMHVEDMNQKKEWASFDFFEYEAL